MKCHKAKDVNFNKQKQDFLLPQETTEYTTKAASVRHIVKNYDNLTTKMGGFVV